MLESRAEHHSRIFVERVLGAVAVVDVEIEDRDALEAVRLDGVHGADRHVVEDAEAHGAIGRGVMPGRAHGAEGAAHFRRHHHVGRGDHGTRRVQRRRKRLGVHRRVGIEVCVATLRRGLEDELHVVVPVHALELLARGLGRFARS